MAESHEGRTHPALGHPLSEGEGLETQSHADAVDRRLSTDGYSRRPRLYLTMHRSALKPSRQPIFFPSAYVRPE